MDGKADNFERALRDIARRANGNEKTLNDIFDLTVAANTDAEERHEISTSEIQTNRRLLEAHVLEADVRDERIGAIERWVAESERNCKERITMLVSNLHDVKHEEHMQAEHRERPILRSSDATGENHTSERGAVAEDDSEMGDIRRFWRVAKWFVAAAVIFWLDTLSRWFSHVFLGYPN